MLRFPPSFVGILAHSTPGTKQRPAGCQHRWRHGCVTALGQHRVQKRSCDDQRSLPHAFEASVALAHFACALRWKITIPFSPVSPTSLSLSCVSLSLAYVSLCLGVSVSRRTSISLGPPAHTAGEVSTTGSLKLVLPGATRFCRVTWIGVAAVFVV